MQRIPVVKRKVPIVKRASESNPKSSATELLGDDLDINYDDLEVQDDKDEILYEAMVDIVDMQLEGLKPNTDNQDAEMLDEGAKKPERKSLKRKAHK